MAHISNTHRLATFSPASASSASSSTASGTIDTPHQSDHITATTHRHDTLGTLPQPGKRTEERPDLKQQWELELRSELEDHRNKLDKALSGDKFPVWSVMIKVPDILANSKKNHKKILKDSRRNASEKMEGSLALENYMDLIDSSSYFNDWEQRFKITENKINED